MTLEELEQGKAASLAEIAAAADAATVEKLRVKYVGRNGSIPALIKGMKDVPKEDRPAFGKAVQAWRAEVEAALAAKGTGADAQASAPADVDATLPGRWAAPGTAHPLSRVIADAARIFGKLGFPVADGPDIESPFNNFTALNTPPHHPSQDRSDTFWLAADALLRTQTSPVQIRTMLAAKKPPVRVICPGRTYRRDTTDATHSANFHQIEGLYVDTKPVSLADLKSVLAYFAKEMMGNDGAGVRFRPHFFPFTEPSVEVDFTCHVCKGKGCNVCKQSGWIEIAGAGMVDPRVFGHVGWDPAEVSGYAFGFGVERIAMIKYGIPDIRWLYENDLRFLAQTA